MTLCNPMLSHLRGTTATKRMVHGRSAKGEKLNLIKLVPEPGTVCCALCLKKISCRIVRAETKLMNILVEKGRAEEAQSTFEKLVADGHYPSLITYTTLLATSTILKRFDFIKPIVSQAEEIGMKPDSVFFNAVINAFAESGEVEDAMKEFLKMGESGYGPTTSTYNTLMKAFGISGKPEESTKLLKHMTVNGSVKPNIRSINVVVRAWCSKGDIAQAWEVVNRMSSTGLKPDAVTYNTIATAYVQNGKTREAEKMIAGMQRNNVQPNERTSCIIISGYCKEGKLKDALRFVYKMRELRVRPNLVVFNALIKGFLDVEEMDTVDKVLELMEDYGLKPDVITCSTIMNAWSAAGYMDKCQEIFDNMVKEGIRPDAHAYGILAKGYTRAGKPEKAEELLNHMIKMGLHPNVVMFTTIINGWCSTGEMECANKVFKAMYEHGISPNLKTFETLIWGYGVAKQPWKAQEILQLMVEFGVKPENSTFVVVTEAWEASEITMEIQNTVMNDQRNDNKFTNLENVNQKQVNGSSYSDVLQSPNGVTGDFKGSNSGHAKTRLVVGDASKFVSNIAAKSTYAGQTCRIVRRPPIVCQKQSHGQLGLYSQFAIPCTLVFMN